MINKKKMTKIMHGHKEVVEVKEVVKEVVEVVKEVVVIVIQQVVNQHWPVVERTWQHRLHLAGEGDGEGNRL